jgi:hypothetical protein
MKRLKALFILTSTLVKTSYKKNKKDWEKEDWQRIYLA